MSSKKKPAYQSFEVHSNPPETIAKEMFYGANLDEKQHEFANAIWSKDKDIIFVNAKAGTGKTFIATGVANLLVQYGFFGSIYYIMSPYGEKKQGWLPGTIDEKSSVYFDPFFQALIKCGIDPNTVTSKDITNQKYGTAYVNCITDTFLRGQNLDNAVVIIDEAQNYTVAQLKKVLTRIGKHTKVIVIGHTLQCDLDNKKASGFAKYIEHFEDKERVAVCSLTRNYRGWISQWADELEE